ncbi:hypothetical protein NEOLEDRAFT_1089501 [Neolentinus lepideus HHB14362 ss-1]|uniref:Bromo domain-containing protein n=1 Tax=Neolentinus lepideus HHB14362 ss-1 TaxID=1314782 RepID=A0A165TM04_9AGAM|nr:hypothetical protein NEOLEDRAFT_1089501 [Neolentinus lepideus HHB14362 ss-1]
MASKTRSTKRNAPMELDITSLTNTERLLLAQAVYELGADAWAEVAKLLTKHPLITRPKNTFTPDSCEELYTQLLQDASLERPENERAIHAPVHLKLAQRHYQARVFELRELIAAEELKFKTLVKEIDEIRAGLWDERIQPSKQRSTSQHATPAEVIETAPDNDRKPEPLIPSPAQEDAGPEVAVDVTMTSPSPMPVAQQDDTTNHETTPEATHPLVEEISPTLELRKSPSYETPSQVDEQSVVDDEGHGPDEEADDMRVKPTAEEHGSSSPSRAISVGNIVLVAQEDIPAPASPSRETGSPQPPHGGAQRREETQEATPVQTDANEDVEMAANAESPAKEEEEMPVVPEDVELQQVTQAVEVEGDEEESAPDEEIEQEVSPSAESDVFRRREGPDTHPLVGKRRASQAGDSLRDRKRAREDSELADEDEQSVTGRRRSTKQVPNVDPAALKRFQTVIGMLHSQITQHRNGAIFQNPIKTSEAPDYHEIVKRPMDLKTIKQKIKDGLIVNSSEFQRDIYLIFANAMMYNRPGSDIYRMAEQMMLDSETHINTFRQTEGFVRGVHRI